MNISYCQVIARIFYSVNRSWSGKISLSELRRSSFLATLRTLQDEDDINQVSLWGGVRSSLPPPLELPYP